MSGRDIGSLSLDLLASQVIASAASSGVMLTVAESCTGGLVAAALTDIAGASAVLDRGFVTYSNAAKSDCLGVAAATLAAHGAVSGETAGEMASGALQAAPACQLAVAITGIAGPGGGTAEKPVGLVWFGLAGRDGTVITRACRFTGDRTSIRLQAAQKAMELLLDGIKP